jgi:guanine nucleotide-binding protein subunit alpha
VCNRLYIFTSTLTLCLLDFRMKYAQAEWQSERAAWRVVIQLNIIRSILTIVDTMQAEIDGDDVVLERPSIVTMATIDVSDPEPPRASRRSSTSVNHYPSSSTEIISFTDRHHLLRRRLGPLRSVEIDLKKRLGAGSEEVTATTITSSLSSGSSDSSAAYALRRGEFQVPSRRWKDVVARAGSPSPTRSPRRSPKLGQALLDDGDIDGEPSDDATDVIAYCKDDMIALWADESVKRVLQKRGVKLEHGAGL